MRCYHSIMFYSFSIDCDNNLLRQPATVRNAFGSIQLVLLDEQNKTIILLIQRGEMKWTTDRWRTFHIVYVDCLINIYTI